MMHLKYGVRNQLAENIIVDSLEINMKTSIPGEYGESPHVTGS